jgi:hypothetical protein
LWLHAKPLYAAIGECLRQIAVAGAMVDEFVQTTQNTNKHNF